MHRRVLPEGWNHRKKKSVLNCSRLKIIGNDLYDPYRFLADIIGLGIVFPEKNRKKWVEQHIVVRE